MSRNRSRKAAALGAAAEKHAREKYGLKSKHCEWHDAVYPSSGRPVEIKSAMHTKSDGRGGKKEGEFRIFRHAHDQLRRADGYYVFVVYRIRGNGIEILRSKRVAAGNLPYFEWNRSGHQGKTGAADGQEVLFKISDIFA